jgi:translation initiation factor IF-2
MSGKVRIYEVAKQLNLDPKQVVGLFQAIGVADVRNHMSSVEPEAIERVKRHLEKQRTHDVVEERLRFGVVKRRAIAKPGSPASEAPSSPSIPAAPPSLRSIDDELSTAREHNGHAVADAEVRLASVTPSARRGLGPPPPPPPHPRRAPPVNHSRRLPPRCRSRSSRSRPGRWSRSTESCRSPRSGARRRKRPRPAPRPRRRRPVWKQGHPTWPSPRRSPVQSPKIGPIWGPQAPRLRQKSRPQPSGSQPLLRPSGRRTTQRLPPRPRRSPHATRSRRRLSRSP